MHDVLAAIRAVARHDPHRIALTTKDQCLSYGNLAARVARTAAGLAASPPTLAMFMPRGIDHVVTDLALSALGRTTVPLPDFFSPGQWQHIARDSGAQAIVSTPETAPRIASLGLPILPLQQLGETEIPSRGAGRRIIYTSGSTGQPKGVRLDESAMAASLSALAAAVTPKADDVHLSILPFSLLLETLAGVLLPLKSGARIHIAANPESAFAEAESVKPTTSVLVPDLLSGWLAWLRKTGQPAPMSLRFVAVGGAAVAPTLAENAWQQGLPVYEGYGLSECCSVVAVNRPGRRRAGTVGRPLDGVDVRLEDGEIIVRGATVMDGYLGGAPAEGRWRTGDLGRWDDEGNLVVLGRKDAMIVTANGRNIHPEWIEPMLTNDPRIRRAALADGPQGLCAVLVVDPADEPTAGWLALARQLVAAAPDYARPASVAALTWRDAQTANLFTPDGRPRRLDIRRYLDESHMRFYDVLLQNTAAEREAFSDIPLIRRALSVGVDSQTYLRFLANAYHHVRHTVPLMQAALDACGPEDAAFADGLRDYIAEETGHEAWILDDIAALGGNAETVRCARPPLPARVMVAYAYRLVAEDGPYALLGMVHVLEGMSAALATQAAQAIRVNLPQTGDGGFSYLTSHGGLDGEHVAGFQRLLDAIDSPRRRNTVIAAAKDFYKLYGDVFHALDISPENTDAA